MFENYKMTTMGVTVFCNRVQLAANDRDQQQLMLLRTLQDNESNIITNRNTSMTPLKNCIVVNGSGNSAAATNQDPVLAPYISSRLKKHGKNGQPPPVAVARRNARERNRVKQVNDGFAMLRDKIPNHVAAGYGDRGKKLSKVETLRMAVDYIRALQRLLAEADGLEYESGHLSEHNLQMPSPAGSGFSGSTHNGSHELSAIKDEQDVKAEDNEYLIPEEEEDEEEDDENRNLKRDNSLLVRLSPSMKSNVPLAKRRKGLDYYGQAIGDEENVEPNDIRVPYSRFSPTSVAQLPIKNEFREENLQSRVVSPYGASTETGSETTNPEEGPTTIVYTSNLEPLSGTLYYKHEIGESAEFMDVVSWWEQEQGRLVHHGQPHAQRLTHV